MKHIIIGLLSISLLHGSSALAQRDNMNRQGENSDRRGPDNDRYDGRGHDNRGPDGRGHDGRGPGSGGHDSRGDDRRGDNHRPNWSRGDRVPDGYRRDQYIINDWQNRNLRKPPRGYRWIRDDNNHFFLTAISTGIIADIILRDQYQNNRWSRGERLSSQYRKNRYVVSDWRGNNLRQPGRGRYWVRVDNEYILVAVGTGIILDIITHR